MATVEDVLNVARKEIGNKENPPNSNRQKYGEWYGWNGVAWCVQFCVWCFAQAGMPLPVKTASCTSLLTWYQKNKPTSVFKKDPKPGDIVLYKFGHAGIVESVTPKSIVAIEGNTSASSAGSQSNGGQVCRKTRGQNLVKAYIRPDYETEKEDDDLNLDKMSDNELIQLADRMQKALSKKKNVTGALAQEYEEAKKVGITDGTSPYAFATRAQAAVMDLRSMKNAKE